MTYEHQYLDGRAIDLPVGKVVCVGRNYAAHARELNNPVPETPILFLKPRTAIVPLAPSFAIPLGRGECHHETEIALLIGSPLTHASEAEAQAAIVGIGLGLDLTLRDLQNELKQKGHPWEVAKAFDGACPLSPFQAPAAFPDLADIRFTLQVNGVERQAGNSADMITPMLKLLSHISTIFTLEPGDVVLTGTPAGVAALQAGDELELNLGAMWLPARVA